MDARAGLRDSPWELGSFDTLEEGGSVYSHPSCRVLLFLPLLASDFLKEWQQIFLRVAFILWTSLQRSISHLLTSERADLFFTLRAWKPEMAHLWTYSQGNNSCWRGLGYFVDIYHKNLCFCTHPKNKTKPKPKPNPHNTLDSGRSGHNVILPNQEPMRDFNSWTQLWWWLWPPWSHCLLLLFQGAGFTYLERKGRDIRNLV